MTDDGAALVARKLMEHFAPGDRERAREVLDDVASAVAGWNVSPARVQIAAIKLAVGDIALLERYVLLAGIDWRDVLAPAESPRYDWTTSAEEKERLIELDRREHELWIETPGPYAGM